MPEYREIAPSPEFAEAIECFWVMRPSGTEPLHRVMPDGCADILFMRDGGAATLDAVGPMTRFRDFSTKAGQVLIGVRFHPGMGARRLGVPGDRITDAVLPLDDLWGARGRELRQRLEEGASVGQWIGRFEASLGWGAGPTPVERAIRWMMARRGSVPMDELARQCGLSARQFRRVCLAETGLTPKFLARVLRFRHALSRVESRTVTVDFAQLALDCGYYDQAHFINEIREFSGRTPSGLWCAGE